MTKIDAAAAAGFRAIEPWNDDVHAFLAGGGTLEAIRERLRERNLSVPSVIAVMGWIADNSDPDTYLQLLDSDNAYTERPLNIARFDNADQLRGDLSDAAAQRQKLDELRKRLPG